MARLEVRALILLWRRDIRGGAFRLMWSTLLGVVALLVLGASRGPEPTLGGRASGWASSVTARAAHAELGSLSRAERAERLKAVVAEPGALEQGRGAPPVEDLTALEWEDFEDDARPDPMRTELTARLAPLPALQGSVLGPRASLPTSQLSDSCTLPRGPPAHT